MFKDLFEGSTHQGEGQLQLASAFDTAEFSLYLKEADSTINGLVDSYRGVMTEALQESAGVMNESVDLVLEQANEHVGNRVVAALKRLWAFIVRIVDSSINFIATLITSNKKFIEKVKPEVEKKGLSSDDLKKITMTAYEYKPELINVGKLSDIINDAHREANSDYNESNKEKLDEVVKKYNESKRESSDWEKIETAKKLTTASVSEGKSWSKFKDELRLALQGGEKKVTKTFSMAYFGLIENYVKNTEAIQRSMETTKTSFKTAIDAVVKKAEAVKGDKGDAKLNSGKTAYLNYLRARISVIADAFAEVMSMKLNVMKRQLNEARAFCMYANRYKKAAEKPAGEKSVQESAVIPFDPLFEDAEEVGAPGVVTESSTGFVF
jgi:hypothetical protein